MSSCGQCGKPAIDNVHDVSLCVDCFAKLQDAVARRQEATIAMGHQIAALRADNIRRASAATGIIPPNHPDLLPTAPPERITVHNIFNIHDSTIGVLTSGQQVSLRNIEINVRSLTRSETGPVALALQQLTKAVAESAQLAADNKAAVLECLEELSSQATLQAGQRSKPGAVRAVLDSLQSSLAAGGSFAEIWATWGPVLRTYFGV